MLQNIMSSSENLKPELLTGIKSPETLDYLLRRRSGSVKTMAGPGPDAQTLDKILEAAARVPDHGRTVPFYFLIFEGRAREQAGEIIAKRFADLNPEAGEDKIKSERGRLTRTPCVVAVIHRLRKAKHPGWEQMMTCGAVCQNMLLAASSSGFAAQWLSEWYAYDADVKEALGLDARDHIAGFIHIGQSTEPMKERARPDLKEIVTQWELGRYPAKGDSVYDADKYPLPPPGFVYPDEKA